MKNKNIKIDTNTSQAVSTGNPPITKTSGTTKNASKNKKNNKQKAIKNQNKFKKEYMYSKPKATLDEADKTKYMATRFRTMDQLQKEKTYHVSPREGFWKNFSKTTASKGKKHVDEFISFLGYLSDASDNAARLLNH